MSISNISVGASFAGIQAHKARHEMNGSIMRLSSGNRTLLEPITEEHLLVVA